MRGKYSPTVSAAYQTDQEWWRRYAYAGITGDEFVQYDPDGYDSYGYDKNDRDRAGNAEYEYYANTGFSPDQDINHLYETALDEWTFDGVKPVPKYEPVDQTATPSDPSLSEVIDYLFLMGYDDAAMALDSNWRRS